MGSPSPEDTALYFHEGAEVEISSNDEGFRGSWYTGMIIASEMNKKTNPSKILVEYKTLMEDEANTKPLREVLEVVNLRPSPPTEKRSSYEFNQEVDAYHNDGWWEGVITHVLGDDEYAVFFRGTREQIVFKSSQLRLHREWVYGNWVPPFEGSPEKSESPRSDKEHTASAKHEARNGVLENHFQKGARVEVCTDEHGFEGAWFAAKIVKIEKNGKYTVEYETLRSDDDSDYLKEVVDTGHIRPRPPDIRKDRFQIDEEVDAFYKDGWWSGGVIKKDARNGSYVVVFDTTGEKLRFHRRDLRVHQEWKRFKWTVPSQVEKQEQEGE